VGKEGSMENYYDLLDVAPDATTETIDAAWKRVAPAYHPERGGSKEKMQRVNDAHDILRDPRKRREYDDDLRRDAQRSASTVPPSYADSPPPKTGSARTASYTSTRIPKSKPPKEDLYIVYLRSRSLLLLLVAVAATYLNLAHSFGDPHDFLLKVQLAAWALFWIVPKKAVAWLIKLVRTHHANRGLAKKGPSLKSK